VFSGGTTGDPAFSWLNDNGLLRGWDDNGAISGGSVVGFGDFNRDGSHDLLFRTASGGLAFESLGGNGPQDSQSIDSWQEISGSVSGYDLVGFGDVSRGPDLLYRNQATGAFAYKPVGPNGTPQDWHDLGSSYAADPWLGRGGFPDLLFQSGGTNGGWPEPATSGAFISGGAWNAQTPVDLASQLGNEISDLVFRTSAAPTAATGALEGLHGTPGSSTIYKVLR
jgi:hypothetical protein